MKKSKSLGNFVKKVKSISETKLDGGFGIFSKSRGGIAGTVNDVCSNTNPTGCSNQRDCSGSTNNFGCHNVATCLI